MAVQSDCRPAPVLGPAALVVVRLAQLQERSRALPPTRRQWDGVVVERPRHSWHVLDELDAQRFIRHQLGEDVGGPPRVPRRQPTIRDLHTVHQLQKPARRRENRRIAGNDGVHEDRHGGAGPLGNGRDERPGAGVTHNNVDVSRPGNSGSQIGRRRSQVCPQVRHRGRPAEPFERTGQPSDRGRSYQWTMQDKGLHRASLPRRRHLICDGHREWARSSWRCPHCRDVPGVGAAASADEGQVWEVGPQRVLCSGQLERVTLVQLGCGIASTRTAPTN